MDPSLRYCGFTGPPSRQPQERPVQLSKDVAWTYLLPRPFQPLLFNLPHGVFSLANHVPQDNGILPAPSTPRSLLNDATNKEMHIYNPRPLPAPTTYYLIVSLKPSYTDMLMEVAAANIEWWRYSLFSCTTITIMWMLPSPPSYERS